MSRRRIGRHLKWPVGKGEEDDRSIVVRMVWKQGEQQGVRVPEVRRAAAAEGLLPDMRQAHLKEGNYVRSMPCRLRVWVRGFTPRAAGVQVRRMRRMRRMRRVTPLRGTLRF